MQHYRKEGRVMPGTVLVKGTPEYAAAIARTWAHVNAGVDNTNTTKEDN